MYYIIKQGDNLNAIIKEVEAKGFVNSYWSCDIGNCVAIALYLSPFKKTDNNQWLNSREYILLSNYMMSGADNWVSVRKEYSSMEEMYSAMEKLAIEYAEKGWI